MAINTLTQNISQAVADFSAIKQAIIEKDVPVPNGTSTSSYAALIASIKGNDVVEAICDSQAQSLNTGEKVLLKRNFTVDSLFNPDIPPCPSSATILPYKNTNDFLVIARDGNAYVFLKYVKTSGDNFQYAQKIGQTINLSPNIEYLSPCPNKNMWVTTKGSGSGTANAVYILYENTVTEQLMYDDWIEISTGANTTSNQTSYAGFSKSGKYLFVGNNTTKVISIYKIQEQEDGNFTFNLYLTFNANQSSSYYPGLICPSEDTDEIFGCGQVIYGIENDTIIVKAAVSNGSGNHFVLIKNNFCIFGTSTGSSLNVYTINSENVLNLSSSTSNLYSFAYSGRWNNFLYGYNVYGNYTGLIRIDADIENGEVPTASQIHSVITGIAFPLSIDGYGFVRNNEMPFIKIENNQCVNISRTSLSGGERTNGNYAIYGVSDTGTLFTNAGVGLLQDGSYKTVNTASAFTSSYASSRCMSAFFKQGQITGVYRVWTTSNISSPLYLYNSTNYTGNKLNSWGTYSTYGSLCDDIISWSSYIYGINEDGSLFEYARENASSFSSRIVTSDYVFTNSQLGTINNETKTVTFQNKSFTVNNFGMYNLVSKDEKYAAVFANNASTVENISFVEIDKENGDILPFTKPAVLLSEMGNVNLLGIQFFYDQHVGFASISGYYLFKYTTSLSDLEFVQFYPRKYVQNQTDLPKGMGLSSSRSYFYEAPFAYAYDSPQQHSPITSTVEIKTSTEYEWTAFLPSRQVYDKTCITGSILEKLTNTQGKNFVKVATITGV